MTDSTEPGPLTFVSDVDLIRELTKRGKACLVGLIKQDETTGDDGALIGLFAGGHAASALALARVMTNRCERALRRAGASDDEIAQILAEADHDLTDKTEIRTLS